MSTEATALLLALAAASTTLVGWALVALKRRWTPRSVGIALLLAAIGMLTISFGELLLPGWLDPATRLSTTLLALAGALTVPLVGLLLRQVAPSLDGLQRSALLVMLAIALHNIPEGSIPFAAAMTGLGAGLITAIAIGLHNIPEGMAVAAAVIAAGGSRRRALAFTAVAMSGEFLGALLALVVAVTLSPTATQALLAFVAGIMVAISAFELIPSGLARLRGGSGPGLDGADLPAPDQPPLPSAPAPLG